MVDKSYNGELAITFSPEGAGVITKGTAADLDEDLAIQLMWFWVRGDQCAVGGIAAGSSAVRTKNKDHCLFYQVG